ncbi:MAG: TIGR03746 family integrating conjugative element protein, partial [Gammaproteobacteria bacterium]|nr:TIGR03746 family integrating conjugative element protein [Gammaproteobacteria bacterium]
MSFKNILDTEQQASRFKTRIIIGQLVLMFIMAVGWSSAPTQISLHYPPDLRSGGSMKVGEIHESEVYLFASYILQQLNNWKENGEIDYLNKISILRSYFTPSYQAYLQRDYDARKRQGELRRRVRNWTPITDAVFEESFVEHIGKNWIVWINVHIQEYINGGIVKNLVNRIPMQVVRYDVDREANPWG